jgi:MFS family permease
MRMKETLPLAMKSKFTWKLFKISWDDVFEPKILPVFWIMLLVSFSSGVIVTIIPDISKQIGWHNKGLYFTIYTIASIVVRIFFSKSSDRYGRIPVLLISTLVLAASMGVMLIDLNSYTLVLSAILFGFAWGFNTPTLAAWTTDLANKNHIGRAMATMYIALELGIGLGAFFTGMIYEGMQERIPIPFLLSGIFAVISFILLLTYYKNWQNNEI